MVAPVRFERTEMSESESDALPLGYGAINNKIHSFQLIFKHFF